MAKNKKAFHEQVAENLIAQLKQGTAPWQKPWRAGDPQAVLPMNPVTGNRYKGINALHLMSQPYADTRWLTYKQASSLGAQVNKGEKGTPVQYWKFFEERNKTDVNGKPVLDAAGQPIKEQLKLERPRVFYATVFNAQQIDGLPALSIDPPHWDPLERAEQILQASGAVIHHGEADRAFYRLATDSIHLPFKHQFDAADPYYATALHELGHWSGHDTRLNRDLSHPFGSEGYAKEELRAEIASMLLGSELGIGHDPAQHVAYVGSWIKALEQDPLEIFRAAADAEKIQHFVLSFAQQQDLVEPAAIKMRVSNQHNEPHSATLTPDLATIAGRNLQTFKDLTHDMMRQEQHAILLVADARRFYQNGSIDNLEFEATTQDQLGFTIPASWNGRSQVQGNALQTDENGNASVVSARSLNIEPQFWGVYAQREDATFQWLQDGETEQAAQSLVDRLALIDAISEKNEYEKAVKLARIHEVRVTNDPHSREEDRLAAKEQRKAMESVAMAHDQDLQKRMTDMENNPTEQAEQAVPVNQNRPTRQQKDVNVRSYLVVPYSEKDRAKFAGARWDKKARAWHVGENADIRALQRWLPENVAKSQVPAISPDIEFADLLRANGCVVDGKHPLMDGGKQRIKVAGDKPGEKSGFYVVHLDGHPAGYFKNNRTGVETRWKAKGYSFTDAQKAELKAQAAIKQQNRQAEQLALQQKVANALTQLLAVAPPADSEHPYLQHKQVRPGDLKVVPPNAADLPGDSIIKIGQDWQEAKQLREQYPDNIVLTAGDLLLTAQDVDGRIWSVQTIQANGRKFFAAGSKKEHNFYVAGNDSQELTATINAVPAIVIAEGYATADTLSLALGYPVVAAFDAGNLMRVAQDLHDQYPHKPVIIAGDDDQHQALTNGNNPGKEKALEAAALVDGVAVFPTFASDEQVAQQLSDFNDLAHQSVLGVEAVKRQVMPVISQAVQEARRQKMRQQIKPAQSHQKKRAMTR